MNYRIIITPTALKSLENIPDKRIQSKILERIEGLYKDPEKQGKSLMGELSGYRSLRVVGQRYRIIYRVISDKVMVIVVAMGIRKEKSKGDIYNLARKIIRLKLLEPSEE